MTNHKFNHSMYAHCESGTVTGLLRHHGMQITEPMVFGISSGICSVFIKTPKVPFPVFEMRGKPGDIRKNSAKRLGATFKSTRFPNRQKAYDGLCALLDKGITVAVQVDLFYMEYIPEYAKNHFNAHYITVVGKEDDSFIVSDCYYPNLSRLSKGALDKARFAKGDFAPNGFLFYPTSVSTLSDEQLKAAILKGIKQSVFYMLKLPMPFIGVKAIRKFANDIPTWPQKTRSVDELSHWIMMIHLLLEERGTGGAGFRFMYATFLQEAAAVLGNNELQNLSKQMMANGDKWREISLAVTRYGKKRDLGQDRLSEIRDLLLARADEEQRLFTALGAAIR